MKVCNKKPVVKRAKASVTKKVARTKRRRMRSGCQGRGRGRCMKPGPIVRNPYLNFLRKFRKENCGLSPIETIRKGARAWKSLTTAEKLSYIKEAFYAPRRRRNMQCRLVCKKKDPCGKGQRKRTKKRSSVKRRSRKPKASSSKRRRRRSKSKSTPSKPKSSASKGRRSRSKSRRSRSKAKGCGKPSPSASKSSKRSSKSSRRSSKSSRRSSKSRPKKSGFSC